VWRSWINLASILGRTESQLVFHDAAGEGEQPLLAVMADPAGDAMLGLSLFERRVAVGVANYDILVPAASACICAGTALRVVPTGTWSMARDVDSADAFQLRPAQNTAGERLTKYCWPRNEKTGWVESSSRALNIPTQVLDGLQSLSWERRLVSAPPTLLARKTAHDFLIAKNQPRGVVGLGVQCMQSLCDDLGIAHDMSEL
jgi:hypothetical protein